jgi:hypothetical protein
MNAKALTTLAAVQKQKGLPKQSFLIATIAYLQAMKAV